MSRRHRHEEHENHEAWAIPYGDLVTLLLAFFVVMYAISTVNEGKYRALSDSLSAAFRGTPRTPDPIAIGDRKVSAKKGETGIVPSGSMVGSPNTAVVSNSSGNAEMPLQKHGMSRMDEIVGQIESAMAEQIENSSISVRRNGDGVEIELRTDSLFPSGSAKLSQSSMPIMQKLAETLQTLPYAMRVEGHTDDRPINTALFPSNWELSAARAATVVHLFTEHGVDPSRLAVIGLGEFRPEADNGTDTGRSANRRVRVIILSEGDRPEDDKLQAVADKLIQQANALTPETATPPVAGSATATPATTAAPLPAATLAAPPSQTAQNLVH